MKFVVLFACVFATFSVVSAQETKKKDPVVDFIVDWAQKLLDKSEDLKKQLIAYRQTHKDLWKNEGNVGSRVASAALKGVLLGLTEAQAQFKKQVVDNKENVEKAKAKVLKVVMDKVRDVISGKKAPEAGVREVLMEIDN